MLQTKAQGNHPLHTIYDTLYKCMIKKDTVGLSKLLDSDFVLVHMTGMKQSKASFIQSTVDGTLNYYSCENTRLTISVRETEATLIGKSEVNAAVFGGGRHTWPLQLNIHLIRQDNKWLMTKAVASTY
jgi:hypothetical protein